MRCGFVSCSVCSCNYQVRSRNASFSRGTHLQSCKFCGLYRLPVIPGSPVRHQVSPCGVYGGQSGTGTVCSEYCGVSAVRIIPPVPPIQGMAWRAAYGLNAGPMRKFSYNRILIPLKCYFVFVNTLHAASGAVNIKLAVHSYSPQMTSRCSPCCCLLSGNTLRICILRLLSSFMV
jgi:hypothetical protein